MRFNNDDYLKAFPREDRNPVTSTAQPKEETPAGDVFDQGKEPEDKQDPGTDPEPEDQGGGDDGNE